jgi:hypothetical protein
MQLSSAVVVGPVASAFEAISDHKGRTEDAATRPEPAVDAEPKKPVITGIWAPDAGACSVRSFQDGLLPTVINAEGAWAGETFCMFSSREETDSGWKVVARCVSSRTRWTSNVRLTVKDDRLIWTSKRGTQTYTRCTPDVLMAQAR